MVDRISILYAHKLLSLQLYLYAQYNGKNARIVLDNTPSTSLRNDIHCSAIDSRSVYFFNASCLFLPIVLWLLIVVLFQTCRPKIRRMIHQPLNSQGSSLNQNYAALLLTGMVFTVYVIICDGFAVYYAVKFKEELRSLDDYTQDEDEYNFTVGTLIATVAGLRGGLRGHRPTLLLDLYWSHANICTYMYTRISNSILWSAFITEILVF